MSLEHNKKTLDYVCDIQAMAATRADVKVLPDAYLFIIDMPDVGFGDIKFDVEQEGDRILVISDERIREGDELEEKYEIMECGMRKLMQKIKLPENANMDAILAMYKDGVVTVTIQKLKAPEPKKPKNIQVKIA